LPAYQKVKIEKYVCLILLAVLNFFYLLLQVRSPDLGDCSIGDGSGAGGSDIGIDMNAAEVLETCKQSVARAAGFFSLLSERAPPPQPPEPPTQRLTREQLLPATPSVYLEHKKDAFSPQLQEFCLKHPIAVVRGIAAALKLGKLHFFVI
jgi:hypothetical protein